jgi:hypothetical protein
MTQLVDVCPPAENNDGGRDGDAPVGAELPEVSRRASSGRRDVKSAAVASEILDLPPIHPPQRRLHAAWRENAQSRIIGLDVEVECLAIQLGPDIGASEQRRLREAKGRLKAADAIVKSRPRLWYAWTGVDVARALANIHAVEVTLIRLSDPATVAAKLPDIIADASLVLKPSDARLHNLHQYEQQRPLKGDDREAIAEDVKAVYAACADEHVRARSFRNILFAVAFVLTLFAIGFGILGWRAPQWVGLCDATPTQSEPTCPSGQSQPTGADVFLVELIGLFSASLVGSVAIRRMRGTSTPYAVPMASLLVKLPTGALTAVAGLLLVRAGVLGPDLANSHTAQLVAYALIFGASQQAFTRLIDIQTQNVLDSIPTRNRDSGKDYSAAMQVS